VLGPTGFAAKHGGQSDGAQAPDGCSASGIHLGNIGKNIFWVNGIFKLIFKKFKKLINLFFSN
jgi:hypothetical protein